MSVRLDWLEKGMVVALASILSVPTILWGPSRLEQRQASPSMVVLREGSRGLGDEPSPMSQMITTDVTFAVSGDSADARACVLEAHGGRWRIGVEAGTSDEDFRDAIVAALTDSGHSVGATVTTPSATSVRLQSSPASGLYGFRFAGHLTQSARSEQLHTVLAGPELARIEIQSYARERYPSGGASDILATIRGAIRRHALDRILHDHGIALVEARPTVQLSGLSGPEWESRAAMDIVISQLSVDATPIGQVQSVAVSITHGDDQHEIEVTA